MDSQLTNSDIKHPYFMLPFQIVKRGDSEAKSRLLPEGGRLLGLYQ